MKKLLLFLFILLGFSSSYAKPTFTVDGINYYVTYATANEVGVVETPSATGAITIPATVVYADVTYYVTSIENYAFWGCTGLTSLSIPASVTSIKSFVFTGCSALTAINVGTDNPNYSSDNGVLFNKDKKALLAYPAGKKETSFNIPTSVTYIGERAFRDCTRLTSLNIPTSVTYIGERAFAGCTGLTILSIPNSVTFIEGFAFDGCTGLTSISIPTSVTFIGDYTFRDCTSLTSQSIPASVTSIGYYAFIGCTGLTSIDIPSSVTSIKDYAFRDCTSLKSQSIPASVTSIGERVFEGCSALTAINVGTDNPNYSSDNGVLFNKGKIALLAYPAGKKETSFSIPTSVTSIGDYAFVDCTGLTSIDIPTSVTSIGDYAFGGCTGLTSISIPTSVTSIGGYAFVDCIGLTSIDIPSSVTSIGSYAFRDCTGLKTVNCAIATPLSINSEVFYGVTLANVTLNVPSASVTAYKNAYVWKDFVIIGSLTGIEDVKENTFTVSVYPNPVVDVLTLQMENLKQVSFYSIDGLLVLQSTKNEVNLSALVSGVYLAKIENTKGQVVIRRVVKK